MDYTLGDLEVVSECRGEEGTRTGILEKYLN